MRVAGEAPATKLKRTADPNMISPRVRTIPNRAGHDQSRDCEPHTKVASVRDLQSRSYAATGPSPADVTGDSPPEFGSTVRPAEALGGEDGADRGTAARQRAA